MLRCLALLATLLLAPLALAQEATGVWVSQVAAIQLQPDGSFAWQDHTQLLQGRYTLGEGVATFTTPAGSFTYGLVVQGDQLQLTDPQSGGTILFQHQASVSAAPAPPAQVQGAPPPGTPQYFLWFLESWPSLSPDQTVAAYQHLSADDRLSLDIFAAAGSRVHLHMCGGSHAAMIQFQGQGCAALMQQHQSTAALGVDPEAYPEQQRQTLITQARCATGALDKASCAAYTGAVGAYGQASGEIGDTIVEGFEPEPCTQYYDKDTNAYLGCW